MANAEHVDLLKQGSEAIANWRKDEPDAQLDLLRADLSGIVIPGADLHGANFSLANLSGACLTDANLVEARLGFANLADADLSGANLEEATLFNANLTGAKLRGTDLSGALLVNVILTEADLSNADLHLANMAGANLTNANLTATNLMRTLLTEINVDGTRLSQARIYGASVWSVHGTPLDQAELDISPVGEPTITVDHLQLAQFIFLLLNNPGIRDVIDAVTSKVVLILGRFSEERKPVLNAIREDLRHRNLVPVLFDFSQPASKDVTGTVETLARMARFIIADLTDPSSIPHELGIIVPFLRTTPVLSIRLAGTTGYGMFRDLQAYPWVLPTHEYSDSEALIAELGSVIAPAEKRAHELRVRISEDSAQARN